ncbi:tetratricopeptide repeat protein [Actinoallomurus sp. NPDC052274]|uniref:tetratricopeptide repeat protein n=1 Tax=Actinoallomurus sp. NPDC052274 TaxID=3155420 RepID=UPI00343EB97F
MTVGAAAALLGTGSEAAEDLVDRLYNADVLGSEDDERYYLLGLARERVDDLAAREDPGERDAALARVITYHLRAAAAVDARVSPHAPRHRWGYGRLTEPTCFDVGAEAAALEWFDAAMPNLVAAQQAAFDIGMTELAHPFPVLLAQWLDARRDPKVGPLVCQRAIDAADFCCSFITSAVAMHQLARLHYDRGRHQAARTLIDQAVGLFRSVGDQIGEAEAYADLGALHLADGKPVEALGVLQAAQELAGEDTDCAWLLAVVRRRIGTATAMMGDLDTARREFGIAIAIAAALGDDHQEGLALTELAAAERTAGHAREAVARLEDAITLLTPCGRPYSLAGVHVLMSKAYRDLGESVPAGQHAQSALSIYHAAGTRSDHPALAEALTLAAELGVPILETDGDGRLSC